MLSPCELIIYVFQIWNLDIVIKHEYILHKDVIDPIPVLRKRSVDNAFDMKLYSEIGMLYIGFG